MPFSIQATLHELLGACQRKYADLNIDMVKRSLIHFEDIIFSPIEFNGPEIKWPIIAELLKAAFYNPEISFGLKGNTRKLLQNNPPATKERREGCGKTGRA
jgi:hypothetical protein